MNAPGGSTAVGVSDLATLLRAEEEKLLACVHCGFCLEACPTYTRLGDEADSPRGRLYLMRAVMEGRLDPADDAFGRHIDRCLGCRACETVCPSGVQYGALLERARAVSAGARETSRLDRMMLRVFRSPTLTRLVLGPARWLRDLGVVPPLLRLVPARFGRLRFAVAMLGATRPWKRLRDVRRRRSPHGRAARVLPSPVSAAPANSPAGVTDERARGEPVDHRRDEVERGGAPAGATRRVALLRGCVQQALFSHVNRATVRVLRENGCTVFHVRGQRCCGALHAHGGQLETARALARENVDAFSAAGIDAIVVNAAGCGAVMKEYGELLKDDPAYAARAEVVASKVRDLFEFLTARPVRSGGALPLRAGYDAPCHLYHGQGIRQEPLDALRVVPGLEVVPLPHWEECCGGAGTYGLMHPELGGRILDDKIEDARAAKPDIVVTANPGCIMQIGAGFLLRREPRPVLHPVELLAESYRRRPAAAAEAEAEGGGGRRGADL